MYEKQKGTAFEGGPMPWLYHKYAGHDLNRDAFMMNMAENRNLARFFYTQWHPQVFLTMHQMGPNGPRFFVPPNVDPIDPNYDPMLWRTAGLLGSAMALELQREGRSGVVSKGTFSRGCARGHGSSPEAIGPWSSPAATTFGRRSLRTCCRT